jgi:arylsulfatase A-like enzyme
VRPLFRGPLLGLGVGFVAGGIEALVLGARSALALSFGEVLALGLVAVILDGVLGWIAGVVGGAVAELVPDSWLESRRHAMSIGVAAFLVSAWFFAHLAMAVVASGRTPAGLALGLMPFGIAGFFYFNAAYWLRREEVGEEQRFGWRGWSVVTALVLVLAGAGVASARGGVVSDAPADRPSVLIVTIDTLRRDHVSIYGETAIHTTAFEDLAAQGVVFLDAITPLPETAPAHAALFTGRHPVRNGVLSNAGRLGRAYETLAESLRDKGYATAAFVSSIAVDSRTGLDQGFDVYDDDFTPRLRGLSEILLPRAAISLALRSGRPMFLDRAAPDTIARAVAWHASTTGPSLVWVHLFEPHAPYEPHGLPGFEDNGAPGAPSVDHRVILREEPGHGYTDDERAKLRRLYAEEVVYVDQQLGSLVAAVRERSPNTAVVVLADHGEMLGEHGIEMNHHGIFEDAIRVPFVVVPPDPAAYRAACGNRCLQMPEVPSAVPTQVRLMDVSATVLAILGLPAMPQSEGVPLLVAAPIEKDLVTLVVGRMTANLSDALVCGYRAGQLKLLGTALYDLYEDRAEAKDIAAEQPAIVRTLEQRIAAEDDGRCGKATPAPDDARLRALGYL